MEHEEYLSDESLIEDDEEEEEEIPDQMEIAPAPSTLAFSVMIGESDLQSDSDEDFHGFDDKEIRESVDMYMGDNEDEEEDPVDFSAPFPADMNNCLGWHPGNLPSYNVKFAPEPTMSLKVPPIIINNEERKVKPLKIKKAAISNFSTPSPMLRRESREWKPSSQFFKPLNAGWVREVIYDKNEDGSLCSKAKEVVYHAPMVPGSKLRTFKSQADLRPYLSNNHTLTLHNFSFRNDPLNATKGQEVIRAIDEVVDIFPSPAKLFLEPKVAPSPKPSPKPSPVTVSKAPIASAPSQTPVPSTSLTPALPSGLLKVKMFGKMKERNTFDTQPATIEKSDSLMEIDDDEDFDLETPHTSKTQSLGNSGVTITPISHLNKGKQRKETSLGIGVNIHMPSSSLELNKKVKIIPTPNSKKKPILRPPISTHITCSIHCPNASGCPQLNCVSCQSLYHPSCVGLGPGSDYLACDFYCASCQPPSGKENKPFTLGNSSTTITSALGSSAATTKAKSVPSVTLTPTGNTGGKKRQSLAEGPGKSAMPLRPIESQSVVNIAGMKYLVVPHPDPGAIKSKKKDSNSASKLPILLKPTVTGEDLPSFEVEESSDGKLMLLPIGPKASNAKSILTKKKNVAVPLDFAQVQSTVSAGYFAILHVFKYLSTKDRLAASKVCKLWNQISKHPFLWENVNLKNCRIQNWTSLRDLFNKLGTKKLDLRKMLFPRTESETWEDFSRDFMTAVTTLSVIDLPKITPSSLYSIVQAATISPITRLTGINASSIVIGDDPANILPLDLRQISQIDSLQELRLKAASGYLFIDKFSESVQEFVNAKAKNLSRLSLLSLKIISVDNLVSITQLRELHQLELGNCDNLEPLHLFLKLSELKSLRYLRLERGRFNEHVGALNDIKSLTDLELIDFEMMHGCGKGLVSLQGIRKFLLIPTYKDEVATINAEAVDAFLSLKNITHFWFGLKTEWLESMNALVSNNKDSFPIYINGVVEMYTLTKLYKTLLTAMPNAKRVKILKMSKSATKKQYISTQK